MFTRIFLGFAIFASAISTNKAILEFISPAFFVTLRMLGAGLILLIYNGFRSPRMRHDYIRPDLMRLIFIASCTTFLPSLLKAYGLQNLTSSKQSFLGSLDPLVTAVLAFFLHNERFSLRKIFGIFLGVCGVAILLFYTSPAEEALRVFYIFSYPELAVLAAVGVARFGWMEAQKLLKVERYTPSELNGLLMVIGGIYSLVVTLFSAFSSDHLCLPITTKFIGLLAYTIIIGNVVAYTFYAQTLKKYSVTFVSLSGLSVPLFVHIFGWLFLGEALSGIFFIALAITLLGLYIFYQDKK
ncbi:MAG: DMT family transporter [Candidatus Babeliaceae bacterium]